MLRNGVSKWFCQAAGPSCPAIIRAPENDMQGPGPGRPHRGVSVTAPRRPGRAPRSGCPCLWQCSSTCGKGLQSRVVQCMHKVTGRHGNECPALSKPAAYRQCYQEACNDKINVNTITSPRLGECLCWPPLRRGAPCPGQPVPAGGGVP